MKNSSLDAPFVANPSRRAWLVWTLVVVAVAAGLWLGTLSMRLSHFAVESGRQWLAIALETGIDGLSRMGAAGLAVMILRSAEPRKLWIAAVLLVPPLIGSHYSRAYHPLIIALAEASWFLVVLCCAREKRSLGTWCIVACAACTTGIQLQSSALKHTTLTEGPTVQSPPRTPIETVTRANTPRQPSWP